MARHRHTLVDRLWPYPHLCDLLETLMSQTEDLRAAITDLGTDLSEAVTRIETKLADADVDLSAEIDQLRSFGDSLDALGADPEEPPVDPDVPVE